MSRLLVNGVYLNVVVEAGPPDAPVLVLLHGFTGSTATWTSHIPALAAGCTVVAIDALGHGESDVPNDPGRYRMSHVVADTLTVMDCLGVENFALLGYSMGGRMALHVAAGAGSRIRGLVLEGASPGLTNAAARAERVAADETLVQILLTAGIAAFVDRWERVPLFASQARLTPETLEAQRAQRLRSNPLGLACSLRGVGTGAQAPLHDYLPAINAPALLIAGALDLKFTALAREMEAALPNAHAVIIPNVGHAVHLEAPALFDTLILDFIRRLTWHP